MSLNQHRHRRRILTAIAIGISIGGLAGLVITGTHRSTQRHMESESMNTVSGFLPEHESSSPDTESQSTTDLIPEKTEDTIYSKAFALCQKNLKTVRCDCFWKKTNSLFTKETTPSLITILSERDQWGPIITRARLRDLLGETGERQISSALFSCFKN